MKRTVVVLALACALVVLAVGTTGCQFLAQKAAEKAVQGASGGAVNVSGDKVTIKGKDGSTATFAEGAKLPDDFPADIPMFKGGTVTGVVTNQTPDGKGFLVGTKYKDPVADVLDFYTNELKSGDWKTLSTVSTGDGGMVNADNGTYQVTVVVGKESGDGFQSSTQMTVTPKKK